MKMLDGQIRPWLIPREWNRCTAESSSPILPTAAAVGVNERAGLIRPARPRGSPLRERYPSATVE